jgi:ribose transport system permease protein
MVAARPELARAKGRVDLSALVSRLLVGAGFVPVWLATALLFVITAIVSPQTLGHDSWSSILPLMTILAVAGLGEMLVIMTGGIDLSIPGVVTLAANLAVGVNNGSSSQLGWTVVIILASCGLIGCASGVLVSVVRLNPLIVTLAMMQILLGVSKWYAHGIANESSVPESLSKFATDRWLGVTPIFWVGIAVTVFLALVLRQTVVGRRFQAVGANPRAAWVAGVHVRGYMVAAYAAAGVLYGAAGLLLAGFIQFPTLDLGNPYLLGPIAAVVIGGASLAGGLASVTSTWAAAFALTLLSQMLQVLRLSTAWQLIVFGLAIAGGLVISGDRIVGLVGSFLQQPAVRRRIGWEDTGEATEPDERREVLGKGTASL